MLLLDKIVGVASIPANWATPRSLPACLPLPRTGPAPGGPCGEEGPASIWSALDVLKVERIDHGVQAVNDAALMQRLAQDRIAPHGVPAVQPEAVCVPQPIDHNLGKLLDAGLAATVNSDDPAYFGGYINENFTQVFDHGPLMGQTCLPPWRSTASRRALHKRRQAGVGNTSSRKPFERCEHDY